MDIRQIERLMRSMQQHGVTHLELHEGETRLTLAREETTLLARPGDKQAAVPEALAPSVAPAQQAQSAADGKQVVSPMVGTFHPRGKEPVKAGMKLKKGDTVCVIEAMKLMNDVVMEEDGEITFLALKEGDMVEFGQLIALYRPR